MKKSIYKIIILFIILIIIISANILSGYKYLIVSSNSTVSKCFKIYNKTHAIFIAIDRYSNNNNNIWLKYPVNDAKLLKQTIADYYNFDSIENIYNSKATAEHIKKSLLHYTNSSFENDLLVIFISGKSKNFIKDSKSDTAFIPYNGNINNPSDTSNLSINYFIHNICHRLTPKHILFIFDFPSKKLPIVVPSSDTLPLNNTSIEYKGCKNSIVMLIGDYNSDRMVIDVSTLNSYFAKILSKNLQSIEIQYADTLLKNVMKQTKKITKNKQNPKVINVYPNNSNENSIAFIPDLRNLREIIKRKISLFQKNIKRIDNSLKRVKKRSDKLLFEKKKNLFRKQVLILDNKLKQINTQITLNEISINNALSNTSSIENDIFSLKTKISLLQRKFSLDELTIYKVLNRVNDFDILKKTITFKMQNETKEDENRIIAKYKKIIEEFKNDSANNSSLSLQQFEKEKTAQIKESRMMINNIKKELDMEVETLYNKIINQFYDYPKEAYSITLRKSANRNSLNITLNKEKKTFSYNLKDNSNDRMLIKNFTEYIPKLQGKIFKYKGNYIIGQNKLLFLPKDSTEYSKISYVFYKDFDFKRWSLTKEILTNKYEFIEGEIFVMGNKKGRYEEKTEHNVKLSDFWMSKYEVTNEEVVEIFNQKLKERLLQITANKIILNSSDNKKILLVLSNNQNIKWLNNKLTINQDAKNLPCTGITWYGAVAYCNWYSEKVKESPVYNLNNWTVSQGFSGYRLPTEAEWEYTARGGKNKKLNYRYSGSDILEEVGWYIGNSQDQVHAIGLKSPNALAIYDMSGNVSEWCYDWFDADYYRKVKESNPQGPNSGSLKVLRGGSWDSGEQACRVWTREGHGPEYSANYIGFRMVRNW